MSESLIVQAEQLTKLYRKRKKKVLALDRLTLSLNSGEVFGFLGPNGAGKSTTIKILTGQIRPTGGLARVFGRDARDVTSRLRMGYLPENPTFYDFLTGKEYLAFVGRCFPATLNYSSKRIGEVLAKVDLSGAADRSIRSYSKGMVQRLGLAQALLHDPDLYILDEPMSGLDPIGRALVKDIIGELKQRGKTVFFSTHITSDVEAVCDRLGVIVDGRLRALDSVAAIMRKSIAGYAIQTIPADGSLEERVVAADQLQPQLEKLVAAGVRIERIEPQRQDLEKFFLQVVNESANEN